MCSTIKLWKKIRSKIKPIIHIQQLTEKCKEKKINLVILFINLEKAS